MKKYILKAEMLDNKNNICYIVHKGDGFEVHSVVAKDEMLKDTNYLPEREKTFDRPECADFTVELLRKNPGYYPELEDVNLSTVTKVSVNYPELTYEF